ncbi:Asp-tRNA(Asn)/Glu-tRNA(Gln) amidotransferase subunit GatC [Phytoactinopolyspora limicola]|uniref:Asp-tRNA(Asn)/Glu-tRNA(Gln) amidotransferase subunit GatC n=1 Tax=Phytoactinopolyspora limicola TaxID=2715536 RepID=UPI001407DD31|nr:Asp-tRNA(Asn)/Glu-tRNA(Gln) amidotransferase subunit GatC [Phytoactinopolyspora limicola]
MPSISRDEVAHLARLARLDLQSDEVDHLAGQLDQIIDAVGQVAQVAADDIPPTSHALPVTNVFRPDELRPCLSAEAALSGAPEAEDGRFRVPQILGEEQ